MPLQALVKGLQCQLKGIHKPPGPTYAPRTATQEGRGDQGTACVVATRGHGRSMIEVLIQRGQPGSSERVPGSFKVSCKSWCMRVWSLVLWWGSSVFQVLRPRNIRLLLGSQRPHPAHCQEKHKQSLQPPGALLH